MHATSNASASYKRTSRKIDGGSDLKTTAHEALARLREGNRRFVAGARGGESTSIHLRQAELTDEQEPFAIILGCSDSRVPVEIVFGQGLGDLFVIRVAGNVVAPSLIGSVEFAASKFGTRLVVVLGHSRCGAVSATLEQLQQPGEMQSPNLRAIVDRIRPSLQPLLETELRHDPEALMQEAIRANVHAAARQLRSGSRILEDLIERDGLVIVGAEYSLESGEVDFLDGENGGGLS